MIKPMRIPVMIQGPCLGPAVPQLAGRQVTDSGQGLELGVELPAIDAASVLRRPQLLRPDLLVASSRGACGRHASLQIDSETAPLRATGYSGHYSRSTASWPLAPAGSRRHVILFRCKSPSGKLRTRQYLLAGSSTKDTSSSSISVMITPQTFPM